MRIRTIRLLGAAVLGVLLGGASARADIALFSAYHDNVARAAALSDVPAVRHLLSQGNNPNNDVDDSGRTAMHLAALNGNIQIVAILIKAQAKVDVTDPLGNTPLFYAAERNQLDIAQLLMDVGAEVDKQNKNGMTPLMVAASRGNIAIVQALLAKGANPRKADFTGRDAVGWAQDSHKPVVVQTLQRAAVANR